MAQAMNVTSIAVPVTALPRRHLHPTARRALLSVHIIASVGLLGASFALLALAISAAGTGDPEQARVAYRFMTMFGIVLGLPLNACTLITGLALGLGTKWGVLRNPWVTAKLILLITTMLSGALVIRPGAEQMVAGAGGYETWLIAATAYNVTVLAAATVVSIFKPGRPRRATTR